MCWNKVQFLNNQVHQVSCIICYGVIVTTPRPLVWVGISSAIWNHMKLCCKLINLKTPSAKIVQSSMYENYWLAFALFYVIQVLTGNSINTVRINYRVHITTTLRIIRGCSMQIQFEYIADQDNHSFWYKRNVCQNMLSHLSSVASCNFRKF